MTEEEQYYKKIEDLVTLVNTRLMPHIHETQRVLSCPTGSKEESLESLKTLRSLLYKAHSKYMSLPRFPYGAQPDSVLVLGSAIRESTLKLQPVFNSYGLELIAPAEFLN